MLWLTAAGFSQTPFHPNPDNATLILYSDRWTLWNVSRALESSFTRTSYESFYYLQETGKPQTAKLIYKAIEGQIQSFSPVWVHNDGTVIGWDMNFNYLTDAVQPAEKEPELPNSHYYPVLVNCNSAGVVLMANNEHQNTDVTAPLYFLTWSFDPNVVDYRNPLMVTDSAGIPFYSSRVFMTSNKILSYRPPYFFRYDIKSSQLDIREVELLQNVSEVVAFDGNMVVFKKPNTLYTYVFEPERLDSVLVAEDCMVIACREKRIYCIQGQALTKSDTLNFMLQSYDLKKAAWTSHKEIFRGDIKEESGVPVHMILRDKLRIWTNKRWLDIGW